MTKISINLVTWNGEKYLDACLRSVFAQTFKDFSVLIIDNGSTDGTREFIKEHYPHLRMVEHRQNEGFARGHNRAMHWSKSDYILCLNQDVLLAPDYLERLVAFMEKETLCGATTGKLLRWQEGEKTRYVDSVGLRVYKNYRAVDIGAGELDEGQFDAVNEVFGVSGAVPCYRRQALVEIAHGDEFFDEDFFSYKEDVDLAFRLRSAGWSAFCVPAAVAYHERSVAAKKNPHGTRELIDNRRGKSKFAKFYAYRNQLYLLYKNFPPRGQYFFAWRAILFELCKFVYVMIFETTNLKAWGDFFKTRAKLAEKRRSIVANRRVSWSEIAKWLV